MITISKIDETYLKIDGDIGLLIQIKDHFSYYAKGYKYSPAYKARRWDGKVSYFNITNRSLYIGLYNDLIKFLEKSEILYQSKYHLEESNLDIKDILNFIDKINLPFPPRDYQLYMVYRALKKRKGIFLAATSCHPANTKVLMKDGSLKNVQDIKVGDKLVGTSNETRTVLETHTGISKIYKISDSSIKDIKRFDDFYVNEDHILTLIHTVTNKIIEIPVHEYIKQHKTFKHCHKLYMNEYPIEFDRDVELKLDPYFVGLYLGDGHSKTAAVTTADLVVEDYLYDYILNNFENIKIKRNLKKDNKAITYTFTKKSLKFTNNTVIDLLREEGIDIGKIECSTKYIPEKYKLASINDRLKLLAGLIDSDGCNEKGYYYSICSKSLQLIKDIQFVAKSLGYFCTIGTKTINNVNYYRCNICGDDIYKIPVKLERKKIEKREKSRKRNINRFGFKIVFDRIDTHYGFSLDGDHLYFLDNFIVNHNSGKSYSQYIIARYLISKGHKILMIVPKVSLVEQMYGDFSEYGMNVENHIHKIYSGQNYHSDKDIIITTYQSLKNIKKKTLDSISAILVDETHTAANDTIKNFLIKMNHCEYKLGFTGTLPDDLANVKLIEGLLGSPESIITAEELIKRGYSPKLTIEAQILKHQYKKFNDYHDEIDYICSNDLRNNYIKNLCKLLKGNTLVLFNYIDTHGKLIYENLLDLDKDVHFIYGGTEIDTRESIRKLVEDNENVIICASLGCFSTGINVKRLHNIIFASSTKSRVLGLQSIGRGLRKHKSKEHITVYDLVDDFTGNKKSFRNYTLKHFDQRLKYYQEENFTVNINEINLIESLS